MNKNLKIISVFFILIIITAFAGCGKSNNATKTLSLSDETSKSIPAIPTDIPPATMSPETAQAQKYMSTMKIYTYDYTDSKGYKVEVILKLGDWLKGSNSDLLNSIWIQSGGKSNFPTITSVDRGTYEGNVKFGMQSAVFAIGTISFSNVTGNGFDMSSTSNQDTRESNFDTEL